MTNIETEKVLDVLSELCHDALAGDGRALADRKKALLKDLLECGFARNHKQPLDVEIENRVRQRYSEPILVHREELQSLTVQLQREFNEMKRLEARMPQRTDPPEAANLDTAGHATNRHERH